MQSAPRTFEGTGQASSAFLPGREDFDAPADEPAGNELAPVPSDPAAEGFVRLMESSAPEIHRFVAQRIANTEDAKDIAQQVLLQAMANLSTFRGKSFRAWLFTIARNLIIDHYRARNRVQFVEVAEAALREMEPSLRTQNDAVHRLCDCRARLGHWVECITHRLRLEEQVAVLLADVHGHSDRSSAAQLDMTVPSFKLLLHCARAHLNRVSGGSCWLLGESLAASVVGTALPSRVQVDAESNDAGAPCARPRESEPPAPIPGWLCAKVNEKNQGRCQCNNEVCHGSSGVNLAAPKCCLGIRACLSTRCSFGIGCRLGIKCCRQVPRLESLRTKLLQALKFT